MSCCRNDKEKNEIDDFDYLVCTCMEVMKSDIISAIKNGDDTFEKLANALGTGTGCSSCVDEVHEILEEEQGKIKKNAIEVENI